MIYYYKCVKTESVLGFTVGKIYKVDVKKREFFGDNNRNYYRDIVRNTEVFNPNPNTWDIPWREFKLVNPSEYKVVIKCKGDKIIAKCGANIAEAKCHEDDEFDYYTGCRIALDRLFEKEKENDVTSKKERCFGLKKGDIVKVTKPGLGYSKWIDYFKIKLPDVGCSDEYIQDLIERYAYGIGLNYDIYLADRKLYDQIYGSRRYRVEFVHKELNAVVIASVDNGAVYLIDHDGVEKV